MELTHYVTLGRSGLRVSPICLGAMTFGLDWGWGCDPQTSCQILDTYTDLGGNFIDTANIYTKGHSEKIIGDHIGRHAAKRDRLVIATKFLGGMYLGDPNGGGAHRKSVMAACEQSLRRLQTDYIDLYWMHFWDRFTPVEETLRALDDLVRTGKVRYIGFSDTPAWKVAQAQTIAQWRGWSPLIALQIEYSLLERTVEGELIPMALEMGLGVTPWSPLKGGALTGKYTRQNISSVETGRVEWIRNVLNESAFEILDAVTAIAEEASTSAANVALAWVQRRQGVDSTIIGARTVEQLRDNIASLSCQLTDDQARRLDEVSQPVLNFPHDFLKMTPNTVQAGTTVDGQTSTPWNLLPANDDERY